MWPADSDTRIRKTSLLACCFVSLLLRVASQQQFPTVNCPEIFRYSFDSNQGGYYGHLTVKKDGLSTSELQVNMSINTQTPIHTNITIFVLSTPDEISYGKDIQYAIKFPTQDVFPKITLIQFNGKVLCSGNPDPLQPGAIQTSIWAKSTITTYNGGLPNHRTNQDGTNANGNAQFFFNIGAQPNNFTNNYTIASFDKSFISNNLFNNKPETTPTRTTTKSPPQPFPTPERTTSIKSVATRFLDQCGVTKSTVNLIIGSGAITPGEFPWTAAIMSRQNSNYKFYCTGNLISDQHVLTAAHCVRYYNSPLFPNEDLILVLGKLNIEKWASGGTIRNPSEVIAHPNYKQSQVDYDVAVIVLNAPVPYKIMTRPICLWDGSDNLKDVVGRVGAVVGWGEKQTAAHSSFVQKIEIPIVSQETCLRSHKVFKKYTSPRTFCAGNRDNFSGPCTGDSGAGFMIKDEPTGRWHLRGIVGFSVRNMETLSCDLTHYAVFIDVAKLRPWILETMQNNSGK